MTGRWWRALAFGLALAAAAPAAAEQVSLTLDQARVVAQRAYQAGDLALANALARRLLEANPRDAQALLILAATEPALGDPAAGIAAGRSAWSLAEAPRLRYEVARHTAKAALDGGRPGLAQFWLRRAADTAPDDASARRTAEDYRTLRESRRLRYAIDLQIAPSTNVNGGAQGGLLLIDGLPYALGNLSGSAQALSGTRATGQVRLSWKLPESATQRSTLGLRLVGAFYRLSAEARQSAPDLSDHDLQQITAEALFTRDWRMAGLARPVSLSLAAGQSWTGGAQTGPHLRATLGYPLIQTDRTALQLSVSGERQWQDKGPVTATGVALDGGRSLTAGVLGWSLALRDVEGDAANTDYRGANAELRFALNRPLGPVQLSARLSGGFKDYPAYRIGFIGVRGGRQDISAGLSVDMALPGLDRFGYMPVISLSASETQSNISRFETRELGVSFGFTSKF